MTLPFLDEYIKSNPDSGAKIPQPGSAAHGALPAGLVRKDLDDHRFRAVAGDPQADPMVGGLEDVGSMLRRVHEHAVDPGHRRVGGPGDVLARGAVRDAPQPQ